MHILQTFLKALLRSIKASGWFDMLNTCTWVCESPEFIIRSRDAEQTVKDVRVPRREGALSCARELRLSFGPSAHTWHAALDVMDASFSPISGKCSEIFAKPLKYFSLKVLSYTHNKDIQGAAVAPQQSVHYCQVHCEWNAASRNASEEGDSPAH